MNARMVDRLAEALRASIRSVEYAVMALQAPERCAMREDLETARAALAAYDAERQAPHVETVRVAHYAEGRAVHATGAGWQMDTHMPDDSKSPAVTLRDYATEEEARARKLLKRAARMRAVADRLESNA